MLFHGAACACVFLQAQHAPAVRRSGGAGGASLAAGGHSGTRLGPCLFLNLERSGVDGEGQTLSSLSPFISTLPLTYHMKHAVAAPEVQLMSVDPLWMG